ncbi:hypothetical protein GGF43_002776 [Coemansia sp. RSA 2618]|nr:hypothetical protein GGF43_002776 [Coemansia sp. RSA 2618]
MPPVANTYVSPGNLHDADLFDFPAPPTAKEEQTRDFGQDAQTSAEVLGCCSDLPCSKSTASLPALSKHGADGCYIGEDAPDNSSVPKVNRPYLQARGAKSHHNLHCVEDDGSLSQSLLSLFNKGEQMPDVADLLSPIESRSREFEAAMPPKSATLVPYKPEYGVPPPAPGNHAQGQMFTSNASSADVRNVGRPAVLLRKQMSMAQMEARLSNRNSMIVSDMFFPGADELDSGSLATCDDQAQQQNIKAKRRQSRFQLDLDFQFDRPSRPTSRYLYDVPSSPSSSGMQSTISRALKWSHRISQNSQLRRSSSHIDQHKIYDIYEESIWHTTHTSTPTASPAAGAGARERFGFRFGKGAGLASNGQRFGSAPKLPSKVNAAHSSGDSTTRMNILRTVKSANVPWNKIRSWKNRHAQESKETDWELSSASSASVYSDYCSTFSNTANSDSKKPKHKQSTIHLFVKRAGQGLLRHSASFYKTISGATLASSTNSRSTGGEQSSFSSFSSFACDQSESAKKEKLNIGNRFATVMRQAGNRLKGSLKQHDKDQMPAEDDGEIVSAYPADSLTGKELDTYLSMSALHSPVLPAPVSSRASSGSDDADGRNGSAAAYAPPKQPPYLGLHRNDRVFGTAGDDSGYSADTVSALPQIPIASNYRLRPTQFTSPFTTLPYGTYAQHQRGQFHHM